MNVSLVHPPQRSWTESEAYAWCRRIAASHYENFPVASFLLPAQARPHIAAVYAFARIADDIADEPGLSPDERLQQLDAWERQLIAAREGRATHPVFVALSHTASRIPLPSSLFTDLLSAFRQDVTVHRYETFQDLLEYCRRSANPVGRLVLLLCGYSDPALEPASDAICTALQLTNFWQDLGVDAQRGRIYIPREDLDRYNVREADLIARLDSPALRDLLAFECSRTFDLFTTGRSLPGSLSWPLSTEIRLTLYGGLRILEKLRASGYNALEQRPALGWMDAFPILLRMLTRRSS